MSRKSNSEDFEEGKRARRNGGLTTSCGKNDAWEKGYDFEDGVQSHKSGGITTSCGKNDAWEKGYDFQSERQTHRNEDRGCEFKTGEQTHENGDESSGGGSDGNYSGGEYSAIGDLFELAGDMGKILGGFLILCLSSYCFFYLVFEVL